MTDEQLYDIEKWSAKMFAYRGNKPPEKRTGPLDQAIRTIDQLTEEVRRLHQTIDEMTEARSE